MKAANYVLVLFVSLAAFTYAQQPKGADRSDDAAEIKRLIDEIGRAYVSRDPAPFERIYLEQYIGVRGKPVYNLRAQLIAMMKSDSAFWKSGKKLDFETLSYESENPRFRFFGQTAIVNTFKKNNWRYRDSKCLTRSQATEVWIRRDEKWRLAAGHATTFQCNPMPWQPIHPSVAAIAVQTKAPTNSDLVAEGEIRAVISEIASSRSTGSDSSATVNRIFAGDYVATNVKGEMVTDRAELLAALQMESNRGRGRSREEKVIQVIDDTGICIFRQKEPETSGAASMDAGQFYTIVLVKTDGRWLIVASHTTKAGAV